MYAVWIFRDHVVIYVPHMGGRIIEETFYDIVKVASLLVEPEEDFGLFKALVRMVVAINNMTIYRNNEMSIQIGDTVSAHTRRLLAESDQERQAIVVVVIILLCQDALCILRCALGAIPPV